MIEMSGSEAAAHLKNAVWEDADDVISRERLLDFRKDFNVKQISSVHI